MYKKQTCSSSKSACGALSAGWQAAKAQPAGRVNWKEKNVRLLQGLSVVLDMEMLLGKPEEEKGQGFAHVASSELDPLLGCPDFTKGQAFFMGWNIRMYKLL